MGFYGFGSEAHFLLPLAVSHSRIQE